MSLIPTSLGATGFDPGVIRRKYLEERKVTSGFPNLFVVGSIEHAAHSFAFSHFVHEQGVHISAIIGRCQAEGVDSVDVRAEAEARWADQMRAKADEIPRIDLGCTPDDILALISSGYRGGPIEYIRICREWLEDGFDQDLIIGRSAEALPV